MVPHRCPICNGTGSVPLGFYDGYTSTSLSTTYPIEACRACQNGIIWGPPPLYKLDYPELKPWPEGDSFPFEPVEPDPEPISVDPFDMPCTCGGYYVGDTLCPKHSTKVTCSEG